MNCPKVVHQIVTWLNDKAAGKGFVVGVSGGVDSAVVSTLCAMTGLPTVCISLPINKTPDQLTRAEEHMYWLNSKHPNVKYSTTPLTNTFNSLKNELPAEAKSDLALVNAQSRLRMVALYSLANSQGYLVAGTGNKIEDFGVGFFTKHGDGAVDLSPIGELLKTEVFEIARYLGVPESIQRAKPTDGLWDDSRSDEDAIGATYPELEWAMELCNTLNLDTLAEFQKIEKLLPNFGIREKEVLKIYLTRHENSQHKMSTPPICYLDKE